MLQLGIWSCVLEHSAVVNNGYVAFELTFFFFTFIGPLKLRICGSYSNLFNLGISANDDNDGAEIVINGMPW